MNLTTKEISVLFKIEYKSNPTRKYRIAKKMQLPDNDDLKQVIQQTGV
jgi:hypothetical protein